MWAAAGWVETGPPEQGREKPLQVNTISEEVHRDSSCNPTAPAVCLFDLFQLG